MFRLLPPEICALLARQHGVATASQLRAAGLTQRRCRLAVERRLLIRPRRGIYVDRAAWEAASDLTRHAMRLLAVQLTASDAVGIDTTAAVVLQLPVRRTPPRPEVMRGQDLARLAGALVRRGHLRPADVVNVEGLAVTSLPVTCASIASSASLPDALIAMDAALRRGLSLDELTEAVAELPHATLRHRAERAAWWADPWSESWLESLSRGTAIEAGLPIPLCNVTLIAEHREVRVDKLWADRCVVGEADGKGKYEKRADVAEAHWQEKQRHQWLEDLGFEVARWGTREVRGHGAVMVQRIARSFDRRARLGHRWPDGVLAEIRALPGVEPPARVTAEVARLQSLGVPISFAPPDLWRRSERSSGRPGSLWTPTSSRETAPSER